ncbi:MAG: nitrate ABC transporter substrate-binding protein, partial [Rhodobacteraceae bacterium]|nr:nitrate ABC transporter substrate-binding protein [Paracoccaceae bacterium]
MTIKSLGNPYSENTDLRHGAECGCDACSGPGHDTRDAASQDMSSEQMMERAVESAIVRSVFGQNDIGRRSFMGMIGGTTAAAALASVFPVKEAAAAILDDLDPPEKTDLNIGFVPITCATPIIMAQPLGFYERYGL